MKKILISTFYLFLGLNTMAHNAKIATFTLRDTGAGWFIEMNFAQASVDAAMIDLHGQSRLEGISKQDYQILVVDYIKSNFHLSVDGNAVPLKSGGINLGSHQTNLKFVLPDLPLKPKCAEVYIPVFGSTYNHTNLFRIYRGGQDMTKFFLSDENDFKAEFAFTEEGIITVEKQKPAQHNHLIMLGSGGIGLSILVILILSAKRKSAH